MSRKMLAPALALCCAAAALLMRLFAPGDLSLYILALPLDLVGQGLRTLSLQGAFGNGLALCLYALFCLLPLGLGLYWHRKGKGRYHLAMGALCSASLFFMVYRFINPALFNGLLGWEEGNASLLRLGKTMGAAACWSVALAGWGLWMARRRERPALFQGLALLLRLAGALLLLGLCYGRLYGILGCFGQSSLTVYDAAGNPIPQLGLWAGGMQVDLSRLLPYLLGAIPEVFLLLLLPPAFSLLSALEADPYGEGVAGLCEAVAGGARRALYACLFTVLAGNFLQFLLAGQGDTSIRLTFPLLELFLALGLMLLGDGARRNRALKLDNDAII